MDEKFGSDNSIIRYTSSVFASSNDTEALYDKASDFDRAGWSSVVEGAYDTQYENFIRYKLDDSLTNDMILAMASAGIVAVASHPRSHSIALDDSCRLASDYSEFSPLLLCIQLDCSFGVLSIS